MLENPEKREIWSKAKKVKFKKIKNQKKKSNQKIFRMRYISIQLGLFIEGWGY